MAVVRIEVDFDVPLEGGVESAGAARVELDDPSGDLRQLLERAQGAMLRVLPQKTTLVPPADFVVEALKEKGQCQDRCPTDEAGHPPCRCERPLGHSEKHRSFATGHGWPLGGTEAEKGGVIPAECGKLLEFGACPKPRDHEGKCVDNGRCAACCPEEHERPEQCRLQRGHRGAHESDRPWGELCAWGDSGEAEAEPQQCDDRVYWMRKAYPCNRSAGHPDRHENAATGYRWEFDGQLDICSGRWGRDNLACRLPEGHDGECGPLPPRGGPEAVDCA